MSTPPGHDSAQTAEGDTVEATKPETHVVIVGGGFAGLACARSWPSSDDVRITLIDKNNYHQFQPLLYQVATRTRVERRRDVASAVASRPRERRREDVGGDGRRSRRRGR
jgi:NADPH-dependent 2,4-dienoyl-CoA reductase/sulfur reductase-like enzyme